MQIQYSASSIDQLKPLASSVYPYTKFSRKEFPFLKNSITIDIAGKILHHHHQRETPLSPKTKPSSVIGKGDFKVIKDLFDEAGNPANIVRATYTRTSGVVRKALTLVHKLHGLPSLLPSSLVWEKKILTDDKGNIRENALQPVLYMPKIQTDYLKIILENSCPDKKQKLQAMYQMTLGVSKMHQKGIAHRDIKPSNVGLIAPNHTCLFDFDFITDSTERSAGIGSPLYASPEYFSINKTYTIQQIKKMDIYSLGFTFYMFYANINPDKLINGLYGNAMRKVCDAMKDDSDDSSDANDECHACLSQSLPGNLTSSYLPINRTSSTDFEIILAQFKKDHADILLPKFNAPNADDMMKFIGRMLSWDPENRPDIDVVLGEINKELLKCS